MFSVIELEKNQPLVEVRRLRTIEEAYDMLRKYMDKYPSKKFDVMEVY